MDELIEKLSNINEFDLKKTLTTAAATAAIGTGAMFGGKYSTNKQHPTETPKIAQSVAKEVTNDKIKQYFPKEYETIMNAAQRNGLAKEDYPLLFAIRKAENGPKGIEFGVLSPKAKGTNLDTQAGWAAATIVKNRERWKASGSKGDFITFLGKRYCPVGAENDPQGLNSNWIKNVKHWYSVLSERVVKEIVKEEGEMEENPEELMKEHYKKILNSNLFLSTFRGESWYKFWILTDGTIIPVKRTHLETIEDAGVLSVYYASKAGMIQGYINPRTSELNVYVSRYNRIGPTVQQKMAIRSLFNKHEITHMFYDRGDTDNYIESPIRSPRDISLVLSGQKVSESEEQNKFRILSYTPNYGGLVKVQASNGKIYTYEGFTPFIYSKLEAYQSKQLWGQGWRLLRGMEKQGYRIESKLLERNPLGSCLLWAENKTKELLNKGIKDFKVIEGYVYFNDDVDEEEYLRAEHTWIELSNGKILDGTLDQFEEWGFKKSNISYYDEDRKVYAPEQYLELCKKYPVKENLASLVQGKLLERSKVEIEEKDIIKRLVGA